MVEKVMVPYTFIVSASEYWKEYSWIKKVNLQVIGLLGLLF